MKTLNIIFNNKCYAFESNVLNKFVDRMLINERLDEEDKRHIISFIDERFMMKSYNDLDLHEFLIEGDFRISQLLCNIDNLYGDKVKEQFIELLSTYLETNIKETDWVTAISADQAISIAQNLFNNNADILKFKELLAIMYLYECAYFDYKQTIEDVDDFNDLLFVNGIVIKKIIKEEKIFLKPVHEIYDSPLNDYIKINHVFIAPQIFVAIFRTVQEGFLPGKKSITPESFFLKFEQLTGCSSIKKAPEPPIVFNGYTIPELTGKWYSIRRSNGYISMYHVRIDWFREDGKLLRSVAFVSNTNEYKTYENWGPKEGEWSASDSEIFIKDAYSKDEKLKKYNIDNGVLTIGEEKFYSSYEDAANNVVE